MDYCKFGQRVRNLRKAKGLSQENLAEMVDISVTHMSHIETGNTKMSFDVVCKIAEKLDVALDYLVSDNVKASDNFSTQIAEVCDSCTPNEKRIIYDVVKSLVVSFSVNK